MRPSRDTRAPLPFAAPPARARPALFPPPHAHTTRTCAAAPRRAPPPARPRPTAGGRRRARGAGPRRLSARPGSTLAARTWIGRRRLAAARTRRGRSMVFVARCSPFARASVLRGRRTCAPAAAHAAPRGGCLFYVWFFWRWTAAALPDDVVFARARPRGTSRTAAGCPRRRARVICVHRTRRASVLILRACCMYGRPARSWCTAPVPAFFLFPAPPPCDDRPRRRPPRRRPAAVSVARARAVLCWLGVGGSGGLPLALFSRGRSGCWFCAPPGSARVDSPGRRNWLPAFAMSISSMRG